MAETQIHRTAQIDHEALIEEGVTIGPNAIIEHGVHLGRGTVIGPFVHIMGETEIGEDNQIFTGAALGFPPQHTGYDGGPSKLIIGDRNVIREYVTIHRGMSAESPTTIGNDNFFMGMTHIAHDCHVGNHVIMANNSVLGGHVSVGDRCFVSGNTAVHQFCRIGRLAMLGGVSGVTYDVPPFCMADGHKARLRGLNHVGLKRAGISVEARRELKNLYRAIFSGEQTVAQALKTLTAQTPEGREFLEFFAQGKRGVLGPNRES